MDEGFKAHPLGRVAASPSTADELWARVQAAIEFLELCAKKPFASLPGGWGDILVVLVPEYNTLPVGQG